MTKEKYLPFAPRESVRLFPRSESPGRAKGYTFSYRMSYYEENQTIPPTPANP